MMPNMREKILPTESQKAPDKSLLFISMVTLYFGY